MEKSHLLAQHKKWPKAIKIGAPIKLQVTSKSQLLHEALSPSCLGKVILKQNECLQHLTI